MRVATISCDEPERLAALRSYGILDTPPEERFDRLTRLVSEELGVPISLVSLVDVDRQWFKSRHGLEATETPRDVAFCAHAILSDDTLVVEDAFEDDRFADNPLVTAAPSVRFYAGAPLVTASGHRLGTLCAIDSKPKRLADREARFLREMAAIAVDEMELSAASQALEEHAMALQDRNRSLDAFVHTLSHDLAGPIRRIKSFCDLLQSPEGIPQEECIEFISKSAVTADRMLNDLRAFFVADRAQDAVEFDVRESVEKVLEMLSDSIEEHAARVSVVGEWPRLRFFPGLMENLFGNLIGNALKYRSARVPDIEVGCRETDDRWEFSVSDNGMGIADEHQDSVFELLFRLHSEAKIPGTGMGLPICRKIVRRVGGDIELESEQDVGTTVRFHLPKLGLGISRLTAA